jgi:hypothetical protein
MLPTNEICKVNEWRKTVTAQCRKGLLYHANESAGSNNDAGLPDVVCAGFDQSDHRLVTTQRLNV